MSKVTFTVETKPVSAMASYGGSSGTLIAVPRYRVEGAIECDCPNGGVTSSTLRLPDPETPFEKIENKTLRLPNRSIIARPKKGVERVAVARITAKNIIIEAQVAVERRLSSMGALGAIGPNERKLVVPQYRVKPRTVIIYDWTAVAEIAVYEGGGKWVFKGDQPGGTDTRKEEGPWAPVYFLKEVECKAFELPMGAAYDVWQIIHFAKHQTIVTRN